MARHTGRFFKTKNAKHHTGGVEKNMFMIITARHPPQMARHRMAAGDAVNLIAEINLGVLLNLRVRYDLEHGGSAVTKKLTPYRIHQRRNRLKRFEFVTQLDGFGGFVFGEDQCRA